MGDYTAKLSKLVDNVIFAKDGSVWVNYILTGINVNPYNPSKVASAQSLHDELFSSLKSIDSTDFLLLGIKTAERPEDVLGAVERGIPGLTESAYPELMKQFNELNRRIRSGELASYERLYWLSVAMPVSMSITDKLMSNVVVTDPHADVSKKSIAGFNRSVYNAIPEHFKPRPTAPQHVRWVFDRARLRGLEVPFEPTYGEAPMKFNVKSFPQIDIDAAADTTALYEKFVEDLSERLNEEGTKALSSKKSLARTALLGTFRSLHKGKMLSVSNVETRNADFPDGYTSYQVLMGVASGPNEISTSVNSFTYIVDQAIGCDADFALRFQFDDDVTSKEKASKALADLKSEDSSNSRDELDADDYGDSMDDVRELHEIVKSESNPVGMKVTALFALAHPDIDWLTRTASSVEKTFANNGFTMYRAVGGQEDMWEQMMPGVPRSPLSDDLAMVTTAYLFGGAMPLRRTVVGDTQGVPLGICTENALGKLVLWDVLNSTDKGNASVTVCGAQGSGKSHLIKMMLSYMIDLNRYVYLIDQHKHGEYEVFASTLTDTTVVDVTARKASLDPLKVYPSGGMAEQVFMDLWLPLLQIPVDSVEAVTLSRVLKWEYRQPRGLTTTRKLIEHISNSPSTVSKVLSGKFSYWGEQEYCSGLIDPMDHGNIIDIPAFNAASRCVVFRTHNLSVYRGNNLAEAEPSERYAAVMYNAIARLAGYHFSQIKGACAFFGDELHFLDGNDRVLDRLIRTPDRTGRKDGNFVVGGSQLASDFGSQYDMIKRKFIMRQETTANSEDALDWAEIPVTDFLVDRMLTDTSPPDPDDNNRPTRGREGEGWLNDGSGNISRVKVLPHLRTDRARMSDTTSSRMVRASELNAVEE